MKVEHWDFKDAYFGALLPFVQDENITDINYNGTDVWVEHLQKGIYKTDVQLSEEFVVQFSLKVSNLVSDQINKYQNVLEAETDTLRISIIHPSVTNTGWSISIRKTPTVIRLQEERMIREGYCTKEILELLKQCMRQKYNMVFCGTPGAGKTELLKYLTQFIPREEKVMTIEDNLEIHYKEINPGANCVELKVDEQLFSYTKAIKTMLRQNPKWVLLSEARSTEVRYLMECFSTGVHGLTTLHADDVRKIPDRIANMSRDEFSMRMMNDVYSFIQVGVLLRKMVVGNQRIIRRIEQIAFFERVEGENHVHMVVEDGRLLGVPTQWKERWERNEMQEKQRGAVLPQSKEFKKSGTRLRW
jgi:pilus assembly protein CpaF